MSSKARLRGLKMELLLQRALRHPPLFRAPPDKILAKLPKFWTLSTCSKCMFVNLNIFSFVREPFEQQFIQNCCSNEHFPKKTLFKREFVQFGICSNSGCTKHRNIYSDFVHSEFEQIGNCSNSRLNNLFFGKYSFEQVLWLELLFKSWLYNFNLYKFQVEQKLKFDHNQNVQILVFLCTSGDLNNNLPVSFVHVH